MAASQSGQLVGKSGTTAIYQPIGQNKCLSGSNTSISQSLQSIQEKTSMLSLKSKAEKR